MRAECPCERGKLECIRAPVVHSGDACPFERDPSARGGPVLGARVHDRIEGVLAVERHQLVAKRVVRRVQRDGEIDLEGLFRQLQMPGTTPTVEIVMCLAANARSRFMTSTAVQTAWKFASGSPIPINTTLASSPHPSARQRRAAITTCSTISPALSCRLKPASPVAQNLQAMAQPAWLETQTVARSRYRMRTVSIALASLV